MGCESADRFLNCVMMRSVSDGIISIWSMILMMVVLPLVFFLFFLGITFDPSQDIFVIDLKRFVAIPIIMGIIATFFAFRMVNFFDKHQQRDREWAGALTDYAKDYGHEDVMLGRMAEMLLFGHARIMKLVLMAVFIIIIASDALMCFLMEINDIDSEAAILPMSLMTVMIFIEYQVVGLYLFLVIRKHDLRQFAFTEQFSMIMSDDLPGIKPMDTRVKRRRIWPHVILFFLTIGAYSMPFILWVALINNLHVQRQWTYEEQVLKLIMDKEGATGIEVINKDYGKGIIALWKRMFF